MTTGTSRTTSTPSTSPALTPERLRFLRRTSVLEKMSGALCDAMLGRGATRSTSSRRSSTRTSFSCRSTKHGTWYRYHHLFRELLRRELVRDRARAGEGARRPRRRLVRAARRPRVGARACARRRRLRTAPRESSRRSRSRPIAAGAPPRSSSGSAVSIRGGRSTCTRPSPCRRARIHALRGDADEAERWLDAGRTIRVRRSEVVGTDRRHAGVLLPRRRRHDAVRRRIRRRVPARDERLAEPGAARLRRGPHAARRQRARERALRRRDHAVPDASASARRRRSPRASGCSSPRRHTTSPAPTSRRAS